MGKETYKLEMYLGLYTSEKVDDTPSMTYFDESDLEKALKTGDRIARERGFKAGAMKDIFAARIKKEGTNEWYVIFDYKDVFAAKPVDKKQVQREIQFS